MMKKTLIALALAATTVSGAAMAWTANGTGGNMNMGGTLTPEVNPTPWEILVGAAVSGLDAPIKIGTKTVDVPVPNGISVLGIRTVSNQPFKGTTGITPQIDFHGAMALDKFSGSRTNFYMEVRDTEGNKIGNLTAPVVAQGTLARQKVDNSKEQFLVYASKAGSAFFGGVPKNAGSITDKNSNIWAVMSDLKANYNSMGNAPWTSPWETKFDQSGASYSAYYGAIIAKNEKIKLDLSAPAASDAIVWKASLPITVSYQ